MEINGNENFFPVAFSSSHTLRRFSFSQLSWYSRVTSCFKGKIWQLCFLTDYFFQKQNRCPYSIYITIRNTSLMTFCLWTAVKYTKALSLKWEPNVNFNLSFRDCNLFSGMNNTWSVFEPFNSKWIITGCFSSRI